MKKKVDLGHFTMSEELTTWAICELSFYYLFLFAVCAFVDSKMEGKYMIGLNPFLSARV